MFFIGYISSLIVAVMLSVFYIGNITQHVVGCIKEKSVAANEIRIVNNAYKTPPYFIFETKTEFVGKVNKLVCYNELSAKKTTFNLTRILAEYHYYNDGNPPLDIYKFALFTRPPPYYVS